MSKQTVALLDAYESLDTEEKRAFTAEFLKRVIPFDSGALTDEETAQGADQLFASLDAEEAGQQRHDTRSR